MPQTHGLGKGIRALIPEGSLDLKQEDLIRLPLQAIRPGRFQPRHRIEESKIHELAESIRKSGLIYPLLVRKIEKSGVSEPFYELIAGERRFRALSMLGETEAPAVVKEVADKEALQLSLIENLQREALNPMEEAAAYERLRQPFDMTQEEIAELIGKDRTTVANTLRLLKLAPSVQEEVRKGKLSLGHARALLGAASEKEQMDFAHRVITQGLSVRQVEQLIQQKRSAAPRAKVRRNEDPHLMSAVNQLQRALGTKVEILHGRSRGWIRIAYYSLKDFDRLFARLYSKTPAG